MGIHPHEGLKKGMRELLHLPENLVPFALIALGYSGEEKGPSERYDPSRVFRNVF
jgi:nitroreductase